MIRLPLVPGVAPLFAPPVPILNPPAPPGVVPAEGVAPNEGVADPKAFEAGVAAAAKPDVGLFAAGATGAAPKANVVPGVVGGAATTGCCPNAPNAGGGAEGGAALLLVFVPKENVVPGVVGAGAAG